MTKISELTSIVTAAATDIIAVVQGGVTKQVTVQDYRDAGIIPTADQAAALAAYQAALAAAEADQVLTASGPGVAAFAAPAGGASDVGDLTTAGLTAANMLRVAAAGGLEERTPAQVLSDIGAAASSALSSYLPKTAGSGQAVTGTLYLDPGSDDTAQVMKLPVTTTDGEDFNFNLAKATFLGTDDVTFNWGFNNAVAGADNAAKHAWYLQLEYDYNEGGSHYSEYHLNLYNAGSSVVFRPFQYKYYTDGSGGSVSFKATNFTLHDVGGTNPAVQITNIGTASQLVVFTSNQLNFNIAEVSAGLVIKNTTSNFNAMAINSKDTEWRGNSFAIKKQDGTAIGYFATPATGNPYLQLSGYLNIYMTGNTNGLQVFGSSGLGSPRRLLNLLDVSSNVQFGVGYNGAIFTNQAAANTATPSGATAYQLPIYNAAGTLLGYIPVYGSAWT